MDAKFEELCFELHGEIAAELSLHGAREVQRILKEMNTIILRQMPRSRAGYVRDIVNALEGGAEMVTLNDEEEKRWKEHKLASAMTGMPL